MAIYPSEIDSDATLPRVEDNITEIGGEAINALRDAVFSIEGELGTGLSGTAGTLTDRLAVSIESGGTIKASALAAAGLVTLPITNSQISAAAGIVESKLNLTHSTTDLYTLISGALSQITNLNLLTATVIGNLGAHISGATLTLSGGLARHVASHIDLNAVPSDTRDVSFSWTGLKDKNGTLRTATQVGSALLQINNDLTSHENSISRAHVAQAISVDTSNFVQLPIYANDVQSALEAIDASEALIIEPHRATQHANGIPTTARSEFVTTDGYYIMVVPDTKVYTYLSHPSLQTAPIDDVLKGDDVISFQPTNPTAKYTFDAQFSQVRPGDIVSVNYGNGIEAVFTVDSIRDIIGSTWDIRINGTNLFDAQDGYISESNVLIDGYATARIERPKFDTDIEAVLAVAHANPNLSTNSDWISSLIVVDPKAASAVGIGFDPNKLDSTHYNLYLQFYPNGNPADKVIDFSNTTYGIDVTGNLGATPGRYTIDSVVAATNAGFRSAGFNYRFVAFNYHGQFGIAVADAIGGAGFSIVNGSAPGANNVIDDTNSIDALGLSSSRANIASPVYSSSFPDANTAQTPTKVILPKSRRNYIVNGVSLDRFSSATMTTNGYWVASISARTVVSTTTVKVTYTIPLDLRNSGIRAGKTITVQPTIPFTNTNYNDVDYGRFIIESVAYQAPCGPIGEQTIITVINGIHGKGVPVSYSSPAGLAVNIYYGYDSVSFDKQNIIDQTPASTNYYRIHEIYVDKTGKTFSHETLRMPIQNTSGCLLETGNGTHSYYSPGRWNIVDVSPKLRGYFDSSSSNKNKYIRFCVLNYDTTTGEFDGYLGARHSVADTNIYRPGPVITSRKNTITRYYDESNIDYIDMQYIEHSSTPNTPTAILASTDPQYVDIELFPSLQLNDEYLLLAKCQTIIGAGGILAQSLSQFREFGTLSEKDFTQSAINFVESGDRHLHNNGIIRGLDLVTYGNPLTPGILYFNGGLALVDGHLSTINDTSVEIPQVKTQYGASQSSVVTWAICANKNNELEPIIISDTKQQYFIYNVATPYYIQSVTFAELISTRKDLTPVLLVTATIASITLSNPLDIRRFINNQSIGQEFVLSSDMGHGSNFATFDSMINWITKFGSVSNKVKVRGSFDITSSVALNMIGRNIIFEGEGEAVLNFKSVQSLEGIPIAPFNTSFKNLTINIISSNLTMNYITLDNVKILSTGSVNLRISSGVNYPKVNINNSTIDMQGSGLLSFAYTNINDSVIKTNSTTTLSVNTDSIVQNSKVYIVSDRGMELGQESITLRNVGFSYTPVTTSLTGYINQANGCVYIGATNTGGNYTNGTNNIKNISIENCSFITPSSFTYKRPPFISIQNYGGLTKNVNIINCSFDDVANDLSSAASPGKCAAISIANTSVVSGVFGTATLCDIKISGNSCNSNQLIYIGNGPLVTSGSNVIINVTIEKNNCGAIGYISTSDFSGVSTQVIGKNNNAGLTISENTCQIICNMDITGDVYTDGANVIIHSLGNVTIDKNYANYIRVFHNSSLAGNYKKSSLTISNNILNAYDAQNAYGNIRLRFLNITQNTAISVDNYAGSSATFPNSCRIVGNKISGDGSYYYTRGIALSKSGAIVSNNEIYGVKKDSAFPAGTYNGIGVFVNDDSDTPAGTAISITNNQIYRGSDDLYAYISGYAGGTIISCQVVDNYFDSPYITASTETVVRNAGTKWIVERNVNQTETFIIVPSMGMHTFKGQYSGSVLIETLAGAYYVGTPNNNITASVVYPSSSRYSNTGEVIITYKSNAASVIETYFWNVPLSDVLPKNVNIVNLTVSGETLDTAVGILNVVFANICDSNLTTFLGNFYLTAAASVFSWNYSDTTGKHKTDNNHPILRIGAYFQEASTELTVKIYTVTIKYRW